MEKVVGFIGLGSLGTPIAENILAQRPLHIYNRTAAKMAGLAGAGAVTCASVAELAQSCSVVFTMVSDDAAIREICEGAQGLVSRLKKDSIHISMSTISTATARDLAQLHTAHGIHYIAAPVFGRPEAAKARKLNFAVSGHQNVVKEIEPLLRDAGAAGIWQFGEDPSAANVIKLCGNFLIAAALKAIGESIALADASGLDASTMWNMFGSSLFNTPLYHNYSAIILQQKFEPASFTAKLGLKDLQLITRQADAVQAEMPLASLLKANMQQLVDSGDGALDWSAIARG